MAYEMKKCPLLISNICLTYDNSDSVRYIIQGSQAQEIRQKKKHIVSVVRITKRKSLRIHNKSINAYYADKERICYLY